MRSNEQPKTVGQWIGDALPGGIPQFIAGPAGAAISRLIGGVADIPAAWLEQKSQAIRDETKARSAVMETLAAKSAELGLTDHLLLGRGLDSLIGRAYREQENRENVAKRTVEQLESDPPVQQDTGPADDWMNVFEEHASKASSETMRDLFSRVLAGEIRKPGSFSLSTMHLISILDQPLARLIEELAPVVWDGGVALKHAADQILNYGQLIELEEAGILTLGAGMLTISKEVFDVEAVAFFHNDTILIARFEGLAGQQAKSFPAYSLTKGARELTSILAVPPDIKRSASALWHHGAKSIQVGAKRTSAAGEVVAGGLRDLPRE